MNLSYHDNVAQDIHTGELKLSLDDIAAIKWLYRYSFEKIEACDCPYEYVYEVDSGGCRPKYPRIFAVKQGVDSSMLSKYKENVNEKDEFGNTALHYAAAGHQPSLYNELLKLSGIDAEIKNDLGYTAEKILDSQARTELLYKQEDLAAANENHKQEIAKTCKWMEFMLAVRDHNENSVMELLDVDDINKQDYYGYTALHYAAGSLNVEMTRVLLAHNIIDIYVSTHAGYTPFGLLMLDGSDDELKKCAEGSGLDDPTNDPEYDPNNHYEPRTDRGGHLRYAPSIAMICSTMPMKKYILTQPVGGRQ